MQEEDKKAQLFIKQVETMQTLLKSGAISKEQYDFSFNGLVEKMGYSLSNYPKK